MFTFVLMFALTSKNRYLPPKTVNGLLKGFENFQSLQTIGKSVNCLPIYGLKVGNGPIKVLLWSQMHGNESTATRAVLDILDRFNSSKETEILKNLSLFIIPQLNPDGSQAYTRNNANDVDLNRDAVNLTQPESISLRAVFDKFKPNFCFNLHGQKTIYAAGKKGKPASLSFLSPAADRERLLTQARLEAMQIILSINKSLANKIPNQIARYDDCFNINCVGDLFTSLGTPTILFEAGHSPDDYNRDTTVELIREAIMTGLKSIYNKDYLKFTADEYELIPENSKDYVDIIIQGVTIEDNGQVLENQSLAIQYDEVLEGNKISFKPKCVAYGKYLDIIGHKTISALDLNIDEPIDFKSDKIINIF